MVQPALKQERNAPKVEHNSTSTPEHFSTGKPVPISTSVNSVMIHLSPVSMAFAGMIAGRPLSLADPSRQSAAEKLAGTKYVASALDRGAKRARMVWRYVTVQPNNRRAPGSWLVNAVRGVVRRSLARGFSRQEAEIAAAAFSEAFTDRRTKRWAGTVMVAHDGLTVEKERHLDAMRKGSDPREVSDDSARQYLRGTVGTSYSHYGAQPLSVYYVSGIRNAFDMTDGYDFDPLILCSEPLSNEFKASNFRQKHGVHLVFIKCEPWGQRLEADYNILRGFVDRLSLWSGRHQIDTQYRVVRVKRIRGVLVPYVVVAKEFGRHGSVDSRTTYVLIERDSTGSAAVDDLRSMGPPGVVVEDSRLGDSHVVHYRLGDHLPSLLELKTMPP